MTPINISQPVLDKLGKLFNTKPEYEAVLNSLSGMSDFRCGVKDEDGEPLEILVDGVIGDPWDALDSYSLSRLLMENKGRDVRLSINSPGGLVFDGITIYNALAKHDGHVEAIVDGLAASAATIIAMGADHVAMRGNATWMVHRAIGVGIGNKSVMDEMSAILDMIDGQIAETYQARTGGDLDDILNWMTGEVDGTWFSAKEAKEAGFIDEVLPLKGKKKSGAKNTAEPMDTTKEGEEPKELVTAELPKPGPTDYKDIAAEGLKRVRAAMGLKV